MGKYRVTGPCSYAEGGVAVEFRKPVALVELSDEAAAQCGEAVVQLGLEPSEPEVVDEAMAPPPVADGSPATVVEDAPKPRRGKADDG